MDISTKPHSSRPKRKTGRSQAVSDTRLAMFRKQAYHRLSESLFVSIRFKMPLESALVYLCEAALETVVDFAANIAIRRGLTQRPILRDGFLQSSPRPGIQRARLPTHHSQRLGCRPRDQAARIRPDREQHWRKPILGDIRKNLRKDRPSCVRLTASASPVVDQFYELHGRSVESHDREHEAKTSRSLRGSPQAHG